MKYTCGTQEGFNVRLEARLKNAELVKAREKLGISAREAAELIGIHYSTFLNYESMKQYPSPEKQRKICDFYRERGAFLYEEDVFPESLILLKSKGKYIRDARIPEDKLIALGQVEEQRLLAEDSGIEDLVLVDYNKLNEAQSYLNDRAREIINLRYGLLGKKETARKEIAKKLGVTRQAIRNNEGEILSFLKKLLEINKNEQSIVYRLPQKPGHTISIYMNESYFKLKEFKRSLDEVLKDI